MRPIRIPLPFGTIKIKRLRHLRRDEREGRVPVWKLGTLYILWRPRRSAASRAEPTR